MRKKKEKKIIDLDTDPNFGYVTRGGKTYLGKRQIRELGFSRQGPGFEKSTNGKKTLNKIYLVNGIECVAVPGYTSILLEPL